MDDHYRVEMIHTVILNKDHPYESFNDYLTEIAREFNKEMTETFYSMATGQPKRKVTESHLVVED